MKELDEAKTIPKAGKGIIALRILVGLVVAAALIVSSTLAFMHYSTPAEIRRPAMTHFHFRMDIVIEGKPVNFAKDNFQTKFKSDICSALLTMQPVHFHDHANQFVHIHWAGITGGEVLKYYGWNMIGGLSDTLGWRFDKGSRYARVGIHGSELPAFPNDAKAYIYVGDSSGYHQRTRDSFLHQPLPVFFRASLENSALSESDSVSTEEQKLVQLNHVVGSSVIFVQKDKPTDASIKNRFNHLEPLPQSQCAD